VNWITTWFVLSVSVYVASLIVPGFSVNGLWGTIKVAAVFGVLNLLLGKLIFGVIGISTLGLGFTALFAFLARLLTNALLLKLADALSSSLTINGFKSALLAALVMSGTGTLLQHFLH
jgi:uncharacterized membrane protein YvlD (DUF360 family)